jgi:hypothetical protein
VHNDSIKNSNKRVQCMCMVEGMAWTFKSSEVPPDCPEGYRCRYYIKNG